MLELVAQDGAPVFLNPNAVWHLRSNGTNATAVYGAGGAALFVQGDVKLVAAKIASCLQNKVVQEN